MTPQNMAIYPSWARLGCRAAGGEHWGRGAKTQFALGTKHNQNLDCHPWELKFDRKPLNIAKQQH
jgi:hypothetical protein